MSAEPETITRTCPRCVLVFVELVVPHDPTHEWGVCPRCRMLHPDRMPPK